MKKIKLTGLLFLLVGMSLLLNSCQGTARPTPQPQGSPTPTQTKSIETTAPSTVAETQIPPTATATPQQAAATPNPETPAPTPVQAGNPPEAQTCVDAMVFVDDVTIPDFSELSPAQKFDKTWRVRNAGSCAWGAGYMLSFLSGDVMADSKAVPLPAAGPGENVDITVSMTAPDQPGGYRGNWQILDSKGSPIPQVGSEQNYIWIKVSVTGQVAANLSTPEPVKPTPVVDPPPANTPSLPVTAKPVPGCASAPDAAFETAVLALINQERSSRGLPSLRRAPALDAAALKHSLDMSCNNFVEHYGSNGSTWFTRIKEAGYSYQYASENIAAGNPAFGGDANWVVDIRWMNSQVHRENILNPGVKEIGISYVFNASAQWGGYTTVDFALP